jgi:hypothetical protein
VATGTNGGIVRTVNIVAVPPGVLLMPAGSGKVSLQHVLSMLTATMGQWNQTTFTASVENANFGGTAQAPGGGFGFNPVLLGGSNAALSLSFTPYGN